MTVQVALLRAINVGGRNLVAMADLRDLLQALGIADAHTLLQSGNVIFQHDRRRSAELERWLETETERRLAVRADYFVRTSAEWASVVACNPFQREAERDPGHLVVMFLKDAPRKTDVAAIQSAIKGPEVVRADGRQAYITYPAGIGRSKLTNMLIEEKLGCRATGRNWNTVLKLAALIQG